MGVLKVVEAKKTVQTLGELKAYQNFREET